MKGASIGTELRAMRALRGLTLVEASRRAGIARKTLQRWEAGEHAPRGEPLAALLTALGASPEERLSLLAEAPIAQSRTALANTHLGPPAHPGHVLRAIRESRGITQTQMAQRLGLSQAAVAKWEAGQATPAEETFRRITSILKVEDLGLRECSIDLYDPITSPYDARLRIREITSSQDGSMAQLLAVEREVWPLAAQDAQ